MTTRARIQHIPSYVQHLRSVTGYYIGYVPNRYADLATQENFYEYIMNDPAVYANMNLLSLWVAGEEMSIEIRGGNPEVQAILETAMTRVSDLHHARKSLLYNGVLLGLGIMRKYWQKEVMTSGRVWDFCVDLKEVDRRRLRIERDQHDKTIQYWTIYSPKVDQYIILEDRSELPDVEDGAAVQDYIWFWHEHQEDEAYGKGIANVLYPLVYIKQNLTQYWADACEHHYKPWLTAVLDTMVGAIDASLGAGMATYAERVTSYLEILENMRARHCAVFPKGDEIRFMEGGTTGENIIEKYLQYIDSKIQLAIMGAELTTMAPSVGSYALGQLHHGATQSIIQYNRLRLGEAFVRDILWEFIIRNEHNFREMGLEIPKIQDIKFTISIKQMLGQQPQAMDPDQIMPGGAPGAAKTTEQPMPVGAMS